MEKAALIADGHLYISPDIFLPYPLSISSAGPSVRSKSLALEFNNHRIKLNLTRNKETLYHLHQRAGHFSIYRNGEKFLENVNIIPVYFHAPEQAFVNLQSRCILKCLFCSQNEIPAHMTTHLNSSKFFSFLDKAIHHPTIFSAAITSGIFPTNEQVIDRMCKAINHVKQMREDMPVGVEPYIRNYNEIDMLKNAGADEIKINLQIPDIELFNRLCPQMDYIHILQMLEYAVDSFGKGKVCSNILFGLGESDESVISALHQLAERGVTPTLRMIRYDEYNRERILKTLGSLPKKTDEQRIVTLAYEHKMILEKNRLSPKTFSTMCHRCCCCDLTPFIDI